MLIDWFTVFAQVVNFLILVFLLKKFLYKPIFEGIDKRKMEIETSIEQAKQRETEANAILEEYRQKKLTLEEAEQQILEEANHKALELLRKKTEQMNKEVSELKSKRVKKIQRDQEEFKSYATDKFRKIIVEVCQKVIRELSSSEMNDIIFDKFLSYLKEELPIIKEEIKDQKSVKLITAQELSREHKERFQQMLEGILLSPTYHYLVDKQNLLGFNMLIDGFELSWNAAESLSKIEENISSSMNHAEFLR